MSRWLGVVAIALAACGSSGLGPTDGAADGGAGSDAGTSISLGGACPPHVPQNGAACNPTRRCAYLEGDLRPPCYTLADCDSRWLVTRPDPSCGVRPATCPDAITEGARCSADTALCDDAERRCACLPCMPQGEDTVVGVWTCRSWTADGAGCPAYPPPAGSSCSTAGQGCVYGTSCSVAAGTNVTCTGGKWQEPPPVPGGACGVAVCGP